MKNGLFKSLASDKGKAESGGIKKFWTLHVLDNAFSFALSDSNTQWFVEHDKLASVNAYEGLSPLDMKEMLEHLEKLSPGYLHIVVNPQLYMIRTRAQHSPGVLLRWKNKDVLWLEDPHLSKLNFLDFYQSELFPKIEQPVIVPSAEKEKQNGETFLN